MRSVRDSIRIRIDRGVALHSTFTDPAHVDACKSFAGFTFE